MVDVIDHAVAVADIDQDLEHREDIFPVEHARSLRAAAPHPAVEFHAADARQVVALLGEEQVLEQVLRRLLGRRLARAHHAIDLDQRLQLGAGGVDTQRAGDVWPLIQVVDIQHLEGLGARLAQLCQQLLGDLGIGVGQQLPGFLVDDRARNDPALEVFVGHIKLLELGFGNQPHVARSDALAGLHDDLAFLVLDVDLGRFAPQALGHHSEPGPLRQQADLAGFEKGGQDVFVAHAQGAQQDRDRQFPAPVDARENAVLGVELEIQPGAAVGNDPGREQQLAAGMRLTLVMVEKHARRPVQLRDDHALGAVDDEGAVFGHERQVAHVDVLLLDEFDGLLLGRALLVVNHQPDLDPQRSAIGHAAQLALTNIERRLTERVTHVLQLGIPRVRDDREHRLQRPVQAPVAALLGRHVQLQEF